MLRGVHARCNEYIWKWSFVCVDLISYHSLQLVSDYIGAVGGVEALKTYYCNCIYCNNQIYL